MKLNGGVWDGKDVEIGENQVGLLVVDRVADRAWVYDRVETTDASSPVQLDCRELAGRLVNNRRRFKAGEDPAWMVRVVDTAPIEEEVGL